MANIIRSCYFITCSNTLAKAGGPPGFIHSFSTYSHIYIGTNGTYFMVIYRFSTHIWGLSTDICKLSTGYPQLWISYPQAVEKCGKMLPKIYKNTLKVLRPNFKNHGKKITKSPKNHGGLFRRPITY